MPGSDLGSRPMDESISNRIMSDMPVGLAEVSLEGKFLRINTAMHDLLDYTPGELMSLSLPEIVHSKYAKNDLDLVEKLRSGELTSYTVVKALHKNGSRVNRPRCVWGSLTVFRIPVSGPIESYWVFFVPHNDMQEDGRWTLKDVLYFIRDHWRLIVTVGGIVSALVSGNVGAVYELLQRQQHIEQQLQESSPPSSSSEESSQPPPQPTPSNP